MKRVLLWTCMALNVSCGQQAADKFRGVWLNQDSRTRGVTKVEIRSEGRAILIHVWGACHPQDCDWGERSSVGNGGVRRVEWHTGFSVNRQEFAIGSDGRLSIVTRTHYTDSSGRRDLEWTDQMVKNGPLSTRLLKERNVRVTLAYRAPVYGLRPDFYPFGTQVRLSDLPAGAPLPPGAARPAKTGTMQVGPDQKAWIRILAASDSTHPQDLCRLYIDRNRNGNFRDDGPGLTAALTQNLKTKAWHATFDGAEFYVPYDAGISEPYLVDFWAVRRDEQAPDVIMYSVKSWRSGSITVDGIKALVAVMDANNDAVLTSRDYWSVLAASEIDAPHRVLSRRELLPANRLMFLPKRDGNELVLEFRSISPDGRSLTFAIVDRSLHKADDRVVDDPLAAERARARATRPFPWIQGDFARAMARAKESRRKLVVDFWTDWCMPCRRLDEWIWTDAEVADLLNAGYVGVKLDGDLEKDLVRRFCPSGYPTVIVLDSSGKEIRRFGYLSSSKMLQALKR